MALEGYIGSKVKIELNQKIKKFDEDVKINYETSFIFGTLQEVNDWYIKILANDDGKTYFIPYTSIKYITIEKDINEIE